MRKADYFPPTVAPKVSGCVAFRGEDHEEEARKKAQQAEQREYLLKQMEQNKMKKDLQKKQDLAYDNQRLAVNEQVNRNYEEFTRRNYEVAKQTMSHNLAQDQFRKETEHSKKMSDQEQDRSELAWTNATKLEASEKMMATMK